MDEGPTTAPHHRLAMMKRAVHEQTRMSVSSIEIDRAPPSYTVHTLEALRTAIGAEPVVRLFLGADQTFTFDRWHQSTRVLELAEPLVVLRAPWNSWTDLEQAGLDPTWRDRIVSLPLCNFSSTEIRRFIARGDQAPADWVAPGVLEYIQEHGLYRIDL
jgi:nicotinate-nucleotide adenylyltransferase